MWGGGRGPTVRQSASKYVCGEEGGDPQYITVLVCMCVGGGGRGPTVHHSASVYVCGGRRDGTHSTSQC